MISHLNGGNTLQPPEPVLSRAEWEAVFSGELTVRCPRPDLDPLQASRLVRHAMRTRERIRDPRNLFSHAERFFDDEPSQRCAEVSHVQNIV